MCSHGFSFSGDCPYSFDVKEQAGSSFCCKLENSVLKTGVFRFACSPSASDDAIQRIHDGELVGLARCSSVFIVSPIGFVEETWGKQTIRAIIHRLKYRS